jgi:hypothetical protein
MELVGICCEEFKSNFTNQFVEVQPAVLIHLAIEKKGLFQFAVLKGKIENDQIRLYDQCLMCPAKFAIDFLNIDERCVLEETVIGFGWL